MLGWHIPPEARSSPKFGQSKMSPDVTTRPLAQNHVFKGPLSGCHPSVLSAAEPSTAALAGQRDLSRLVPGPYALAPHLVPSSVCLLPTPSNRTVNS